MDCMTSGANDNPGCWDVMSLYVQGGLRAKHHPPSNGTGGCGQLWQLKSQACATFLNQFKGVSQSSGQR